MATPRARPLYRLVPGIDPEPRAATKACLLVRSRGGLMLYNWAVEHPSSVACVAGIYPVCNLDTYPGLKNASAAYGMTEENSG